LPLSAFSCLFFFFSSRRRHTRFSRDWSSDVCSSDLPKTEEMEQRLWETVTRLAPLKPEFVSVTYGAGGSTRERTIRTVARILKRSEERRVGKECRLWWLV